MNVNSRHSIRLKDYDYSTSGMYFVTICTHQRECFLGEVKEDSVQASQHGQVVEQVWNGLSNHYLNLELDAFIVMPNHIHGIIVLTDSVGAGLSPAHIKTSSVTLAKVVNSLKSFSTRQINVLRETPAAPVWQRNYYEHIIRNEQSLNAIREYILFNPARWASDENNPAQWSKS